MAAAEYYNDPRYRPAAPQHDYDSRPSRRPDHHMPLTTRMDAHEDSPIEEIQRDFPPGEYAYGQRPKRRSRRTRDYDSGAPPRRARSAHGHGRYDDPPPYYDDHRSSRRSDRHRSDRHRPKYDDDLRRDRRSRHHHSSPSPSPPPRRRKPKRRKSLTEQAMGAMGALGLGNALSGASDSNRRRHRSDSRGAGRRRRNRSYSSSSSRSRSRDGRVRGPGGMNQQQIAQAVKAALTAGAAEAYRARKEPGGWTGEKGKRIVTAALASGGADGVLDRGSGGHGKRHIIESALAGLATNRAVNGPRSRSRSRDGRSRHSKSGAVKGIATSGALVAAGKEIYDHLRSRSKSRGRDRSSSRSDDGDDRRHGRKKRSQSVSDYVSKGLAAVGLTDPDDKHHSSSRRHGHSRRDRDRERPSRYDDSYDSASDSYDSEADSRPRRRGHGGGGGGHSREVGRSFQPDVGQTQDPHNTALSKYERGSGGAVGRYHPPYTSKSYTSSDSDSDLGSSSGEEHTRKKMVRHQMLTTGMATLATVHAAHQVVGSVKKRKERLAAVRDGDLDPEDARRMRWRNNAKDAASVGIAALGVHGAVDEWRDAGRKRAECRRFQEEAEERRARRRESRRSKSVDAGIRRWRDGTEEPYYSMDG
ncbi:hypothetical protein FQN54_005655 [Arachnomyces sp. PD_36]|nr:hypothetical protein FQN54_005655 [Arachnomyces sp. PD_36]